MGVEGERWREGRKRAKKGGGRGGEEEGEGRELDGPFLQSVDTPFAS